MVAAILIAVVNWCTIPVNALSALATVVVAVGV